MSAGPGHAERIADAVLYEGYMLYPYRPSAVKNRQRFNFGVLYPEEFTRRTDGSDRCHLQAECLSAGPSQARLSVRIRFLHLIGRSIGRVLPSAAASHRVEELQVEPVDRLTIDDRVYHNWQEATEREVQADGLCLSELLSQPCHRHFTFPAGLSTEPLKDASGQTLGVMLRRHHAIEGDLDISAWPCEGEVIRIRVRVTNLTPPGAEPDQDRTGVLLHSLVSAHAILSLSGGEFVSLLDPPEGYRGAAAACENAGVWPVLVGENGSRNVMLASPIILYDYPEIAPESAGDLFDGTEIDEILSLRIMTLTDDEKSEMRHADERARRILERTESLAAEQLLKLHGTLRQPRAIREDSA